MIFLVFCGFNAILLSCASLAGGIGTFVNLDSVLIVAAGAVLSAVSAGHGRYRALLLGLRQVFAFSGRGEKSPETRSVFAGVSALTLAFGFCSTLQGLFAGVLLESAVPIENRLVYASFTSVYSLILVAFLFVPVITRNS
ncbi:MAG: hypothetical protein GX430_10090 [Treponema sp.]|nr:hypothetical protein [Treponema sp.]